MSPVKAVGKRIVEISSGKTVGKSSSHAKAAASARIRNAAISKKRK